MPASVPPLPPRKKSPVRRLPTRLESVDDFHIAIQAQEPPPLPPVADAPGSPKTTPAPGSPKTVGAPAPKVPLFKPTSRPPVALLTVFDDGEHDGDVVRIRGERFVIGRSEGDLLLPHDGQVSTRHAEVVRQQVDDGSWAWELIDLDSTNGTFVRAGTAILKDGQEFLIGQTRYRFTHGEGAAAQLIELRKAGAGPRLSLIDQEYWIGSERPVCAIVPVDDPFVSPRHARLSRDAKDRWHISNNRAINGVWLRVEQTDLTRSCFFQVGEQRFSFKVPAP
jgi:pSer/pThr/pTyr-binding forkhead associated (FHA) protein